MNDCTFCASLVRLVAAIIFSLNQILNYFYSSPTSGMWDLFTFDFDTTIYWARNRDDRISTIVINLWTPTFVEYLHLLWHLSAAAKLGRTQFDGTL